jgi:hypothetical protein
MAQASAIRTAAWVRLLKTFMTRQAYARDPGLATQKPIGRHDRLLDNR